MKSMIKIFIALAILTITRCNCKKNLFETIEHKPPYSIVFCDFTSSVDTLESSMNIKKNALEILLKRGMNTNIEFYIINKITNSPCLFKNIPLDENARPSEKRAFVNILRQRIDSLTAMLNAASSKASYALRKEPTSCIIACIERAIGYFENYNPEPETPLHLFILSDMLECCTFKNKQKINLEPNNDIEKQLNLIPAITDSTLSFRKFKNIRIDVIVSTNKALEENYPAFKTFWERVFQSYGYNIKNKITVNLPNDISNKD